MPTGIGYLRNFFIIRASDAIIAIEGYSGTTSEAAFAISEGKSVVSIGDLQIRTKDNDGKIIYENDPQKAVFIALHEARKYIEKFR
jgi:predicted Rossmann-fold nucleotide-binding protein